MHEEEAQRFPFQYIKSVKSSKGCMLMSNCKMHKVFWVHFHDHFARYSDLQFQEFHSYLANFPCLVEAEVASYEDVVTECEVHDVLKQVGLNKSLGLDGLPYKAYLKQPHMFVTILMDMFNHWFTQGAIPGSVTKGAITLLKKGGRHIWEDLNDIGS